jgi:hypothetical protein
VEIKKEGTFSSFVPARQCVALPDIPVTRVSNGVVGVQI